MSTDETSLTNFPEDNQALQAMLRALLREREQEKQRVEDLAKRAEAQSRRADDLYVENLRLQKELARYKKLTYGPRADRLSETELAQALLDFAEELEQKPIHADDVPPQAEPDYELRRVKRRKGRRALANFENLPVTTKVYELSAKERACPCCGVERKEIGAEQSWQIEYLPGRFERIQHVRKKYACPGCEREGENPRMEVAAKPEAAIEKGLAGPGLLAYIVTSKFSDYLPLYRLEDIFERQGFQMSRATQSVWCGDVADLVESLYQRMAERVRESHVVATDDTTLPMLSPGKTQSARMWVYVGDETNPYNVFDFTLNRGRDGPKHFLKQYQQVLLADAYGGYNGVVAGNADHACGMLGACEKKNDRGGAGCARDGTGGNRLGARALCRGKAGQGCFRGGASGVAPSAVNAGVGRVAAEAAALEGAIAAQASHGGGGELHPEPVGGAERILLGRSGRHRQ